MRITALPALAILLFAIVAATPATARDHENDPRLRGAYKFNEGGWTYVHLQGTPEQVGFQHGYLLAREIEDNVQVYMVTAPHQDKRPWSFFRDAAQTVLWPHIEPEYQEELKGIVEGLQAQGSTLDLWDIVALNGDIELSNYYLPTVNARRASPIRRRLLRRANAARSLRRDQRPKTGRS